MSGCIKPLIQEYLDKELSPPEMERVSSHCAACRDCGRELEELKSVCEAVSSLGNKPLPVGFLKRLERRRQTAGTSARRGFSIPAPARAAAFAFSAAAVVVVAYERLDVIFPVKVQGAASAPDLTLNEPVRGRAVAPAAPAALAAKSADAAPAPGLKLAHARGKALIEETERKAEERRVEVVARENAAAKAAAESASAQVSNEELVAALEEQKRKEGVKILPRQADSDAELKRMVAGMGDPAMVAALRGAAPVDGPTPAMLSMRGAPNTAPRGLDSMFGQLSGGSGAGTRVTPAPTAGASSLIINSEAEREALWLTRGLNATPPRVNYEKQRLLVVVANDYRTVVEIAGLVEGSDRILLTYRLGELPEGATRRTGAPSYQYRTAPRSHKPVQFQRLP